MIYVGTHIMPWDVGEFRHQVRLHRIALGQLPKEDLNNITLIPTLNINDQTIDWENSKIPKEYYIEHFNISCKTLDGIINVIPRIGGVISTTGALKKNIDDILTDNDYYLWIDPDISYPYVYWNYLLGSLNVLKGKLDHFIVSPSTTKLWDTSWDVLVASNQINLPYGNEGWYNSNFDDYFHSQDEPTLIPTSAVKMGGGFGNLITGKTLKLFGIPEEYTLYGGVDTYVMLGAEVMRQQNKLIQYKIDNLITIQDFKFSDKNMYKSFTPPLMNKDDQREINESKENIYQNAVQSLIKKLSN